jgi:acyl dehydratase
MPHTRSKLYLEDLKVGDRFVSDEHPLDARQIISFAEQFDPQAFHLDEEQAGDTFFKGLAASGWHTAAVTMKLLTSSLPLAGGVIGAGGEISWPQPTRPNDVLHVESEVLEITPSRTRPDRGILRLETLTRNQRGEVLQRLTAKLVVVSRATEVPLRGHDAQIT